MDDGRDDAPDAAFRFVFQLGAELMIYLYVIQAGRRGEPRGFFHTCWIKDGVATWVELEDLGPPRVVEASMIALPLLYQEVEVCGRADQRFGLRAQTFSAQPDERGAPELTMRFELAEARGGVGWLTWARTRGWELSVADAPTRPLGPDEWLEFSPPG